MKIYSIRQTYTINRCPQQQRNITFTGDPNNGIPNDEMIKLKKATGLFEQISQDFCDKINMENQGLYKKAIPNCLMFEIQNDGDELFPIEWIKKTADCNFIHLADRNNDDLTDALWEELKKSKDTFEQTKRRTIIHIDGFDRLITKSQNSLENIDSLKSEMCRTATDFGATIVFSTKNASSLTSEAIAPQRVTRIQVNNSKAELEKYNAFLDSRGYFKDYEKRIASTTTEVPKPVVNKDTAEVPLKQVEQPKQKTEPKKIEVQAEQHEPSTTSVKPGVSTPTQIESSRPTTSDFGTQPPRQSSTPRPSITTVSSSSEPKIEAEIKPPKAPDIPSSIKKTVEKSTDGPKTFKVIAILVAIGAAIAGVVYFIKNSHNNHPTKKNN